MFFLLLSLVAIPATFFAAKYLVMLINPHYHAGADDNATAASSKPRILIVTPETRWFGGAESHIIQHYRQLTRNNYHVAILAHHGTQLCEQFIKEHIPFYSTHAGFFRQRSFRINVVYHLIMARCLRIVCKKENITIIHCNNCYEAPDVGTVAKQLGIKSVFTRHMVHAFRTQRIKSFDAAIVVSPYSVDYVSQENITKHLSLGTVTWIPPFHNAQKFLSYQPTEARHAFYKQHFAIDLLDMPTACMIANFYDDFDHKNHPLLFKTIATLVHEQHKPIQVMLAGNCEGAMKKIITDMIEAYDIGDYVHLLGYTKQIPGILYHSDMMVLSSKVETFAVVYFEAGMMKKPSIGADQTGADFVILHEKTGLLFRNNDVESFASAIAQLIDNPELSRQMGLNAYEHIMANYSPEATFAKHAALYATLSVPRQP